MVKKKQDHCQSLRIVQTTLLAMVSSQHFQADKNNTNYKGAMARELFKYQDSFGAAPCYQREKPKTVPSTHNMQHVAL